MRKEMFNHEITILRDTYRRLLRRNAKVNLIKLIESNQMLEMVDYLISILKNIYLQSIAFNLIH